MQKTSGAERKEVMELVKLARPMIQGVNPKKMAWQEGLVKWQVIFFCVSTQSKKKSDQTLMVICYVLQASPIFGDQSPFEALFAFLQKQNICPKLTKKTTILLMAQESC